MVIHYWYKKNYNVYHIYQGKYSKTIRTEYEVQNCTQNFTYTLIYLYVVFSDKRKIIIIVREKNNILMNYFDVQILIRVLFSHTGSTSNRLHISHTGIVAQSTNVFLFKTGIKRFPVTQTYVL